jgi:hypothetical protein
VEVREARQAVLVVAVSLQRGVLVVLIPLLAGLESRTQQAVAVAVPLLVVLVLEGLAVTAVLGFF